MGKTGRNEPCHCGSGKKYKHCCLGKDNSQRIHNQFKDLKEYLNNAIEGRVFE